MIIETWIAAIIFILVATSGAVCALGWMHEENKNNRKSRKIKDLQVKCDFQAQYIEKLKSEIAVLKVNLDGKKK
jgi:hypothetical protein